MKQQMMIDLGGSDADGVYDSADYPELFDYMPETIWTLENDAIVTYSKVGEEASWEAASEESPPEEAEASDDEGVAVVSDDEATIMTFFADGHYTFSFESYGISENGEYTFEDGVLTVTNANGTSFTAEGSPLALHYAYSQSDQLVGDFTIDPAIFG